MNTPELIAFIKKNLIGVTCGLVSITLAALIYVRSDQAQEKTELLQQKMADGEKILATVKNSARLDEQLNMMQAASHEFDQRLVQASDLARNLQFFYKLETDTGVKLTDIHQAGTAKPKAQFMIVPYVLTAQGSYRQILDLLGRLEVGPHFYQLTSFSCSHTGPATDPNNDAVSLTLSFNFLGLL